MKKLLLIIISVLILISLNIPAIAFNHSHNKLVKQTDNDRNMILGIAVIYYGYDCTLPIMSFFQGFDKIETAYWNLLCEDGCSFRITIRNDPDGTMDVVPCEKLYPSEIPCFKKFN